MRSEIHRTSEGITGTVAIGFTPPLAAVFELPFFLEMRKRYPEVKLRIFPSVSGYLDELLINGRLDLAMLPRNEADSNALSIPLAKERLCLVRGKQASQQTALTTEFKSLENLPLVLPSADQALRRLIEKAAERENIKLNILADIDSLSGLLSIVNTGIANTILSSTALVLRPDLPLHSSTITPYIERTVAICPSRASPVTPAAHAAIEVLTELASNLLPTFS
ncbi:LysR substrate-binding domain-containing protein [Mycoavidus cysteinexigens]|nr:LysR substrate-binding domain-containing protein [Mycoavidus cysteinexigens]